MKIELVQLYFTVKPPGGGVTTTSYTSKDYSLSEDDRGITVKHRNAPAKTLRIPWANVCGVWYDEDFAAIKPTANEPPPDGTGGRFRKAV